MAEPPSSPPREDASSEDALAWYKSQYEQLEHELSEFQASSKELEAELEKDLDAADKRERSLREKADGLSYEVEEWKRKYKESKAEANAAQNTLEKEITTLRDTNRTLQLRLRDIEVANDDFERQARNTTSSLEDMESKYNVAIERTVIMEEEIKMGEQEREQLRVDTQRLREEVSELKIEREILQNKAKKHESRHLSAISTDISILESPTFEHSPGASTASSPLITTPPDSKSVSTAETISEVQDPPSPPMSEASSSLSRPPAATPSAAGAGSASRTPAATSKKSRLPSADHSITPKPKHFASSTSSSSGRTLGSRVATTSNANLRTPAPRPPPPRTGRAASHRVPPSSSLTHIRSLTAQMQRLEARVQSARSKLPGPTATPPKASPRGSAIGLATIPSTVTIRSRKRTIGSTASSSVAGDDTPTNYARHHAGTAEPDFRSSTSSAAGGRGHISRLSTSGVSRLSFGPLPNRNPDGSRPSSRASMSSLRPPSRADSHYDTRSMPPPRPMSRASLGGGGGGNRSKTPISGRPSSRLSGSMHGHTYSQSINHPTAELDELMSPGEPGSEIKTPSRRGTFSRFDGEGGAGSAIPLPSSGMRRMSGASMGGRRSSSGLRDPGGTGAGHRKMSELEDLGETY